jgi:hypothetical protein
LQRDILAALEQRPGWTRPKAIFAALGREPTPPNRVAVSKALEECNLIEVGQSEVMNVGKSYLYRARPGGDR